MDSENRSGSIAIRDLAQIERANAAGAQPVLFIHGLWLLANSWDRWARLFENAGLIALTPGWPDDPETVSEARDDPDRLAHKKIGQVADYFGKMTGSLNRKPLVVGHSFGGLLAQILAGRGLAAATVAVSPAPFQGVLPLPMSALKSASPVLSNPANYGRAVALTFEQFQYAFANAVDDAEARHLYDTYAVPAPGAPLFQDAFANFNPWSEAKVDSRTGDRGPLLIIAGEKDHTVPTAITDAAYKIQQRNVGVTEYRKFDRGHALTIDSGWGEIAECALDFARRVI